MDYTTLTGGRVGTVVTVFVTAHDDYGIVIRTLGGVRRFYTLRIATTRRR